MKTIIDKLRLGMTREEVIFTLGEPDDVGGVSRKYRTPSIFKYGRIEFFFKPWKSGRLKMAYTEDEEGEGHTLLS